MANNLWIQNNPHAAAMGSKTFQNSGIRQQGKRLVYWPKEVICLPAVDPYRFWNFVVGRAAAASAAAGSRNDPGSSIGIHADNDSGGQQNFFIGNSSSTERTQ